jgi:2-keto-4-pentenoate hydratase/2-oxohepta-3-ene-1,7-dioic acid hydratase in catechol pathway
MRIARLRGHEEGQSRFARLAGERAHAFDRAPWLGGTETGESFDWSEADLLCPVVPSKIIGVGRNYAAHARELGHDIPVEPLLFLKPPSALLNHGGAVILPPESRRVEHEAELAVVIGRRAKNIAADEVPSYVLGYTCGCDVTARDLQRRDVQFARSKGFDTFCPVGPWIETQLDTRTVRIQCRVRGQLRQDGNTSQMLFDVPTIVAYASHMMTLEPGDIILTGTPEGVGPIEAGDLVEVDIAGIGTLKLHVRT